MFLLLETPSSSIRREIVTLTAHLGDKTNFSLVRMSNDLNRKSGQSLRASLEKCVDRLQRCDVALSNVSHNIFLPPRGGPSSVRV